MVHGFGGSHLDLRNMKYYIAYKHPNSLFLLSASNEGEKSEECITVQG